MVDPYDVGGGSIDPYALGDGLEDLEETVEIHRIVDAPPNSEMFLTEDALSYIDPSDKSYTQQIAGAQSFKQIRVTMSQTPKMIIFPRPATTSITSREVERIAYQLDHNFEVFLAPPPTVSYKAFIMPDENRNPNIEIGCIPIPRPWDISTMIKDWGMYEDREDEFIIEMPMDEQERRIHYADLIVRINSQLTDNMLNVQRIAPFPGAEQLYLKDIQTSTK